MDSRLLEISQIFGIVDVSLWVKVTIADFDWMEEFEFRHNAIIPFHFLNREEAKSAKKNKKLRVLCRFAVNEIRAV